MHRQPAMRIGAATLLLAAGLAAALTLGPSSANAYTITALPNMGFGITMTYLPQNGCHSYKVGWRNDPKTDLGSDCDPGFQQRLDAFMASHCPPFVCPENAPTTVATTQTETDMLVTTAPAPDPVTTTVQSLVIAPPAPDNDTPPPAADIDPVPPSPPVAAFAVINDSPTVSVTDLKGNTNIVWMFGDGANGSGPQTTHRYSKPGRYVIVEEAVSPEGLAAQATETVTVTRPLPPKLAAMLR